MATIDTHGKPDESSNTPSVSFKTMLWRGWRKKCPECGQGPLYKNFLTLHDRCPVCGLKYLPNQGDLLGPMFFIDRVVFLIPLVTVFCFIVPNAPPSVYYPVGAVLMLLLVITLPNRNGLSVAWDYHLRTSRDE